VGTRVIESDAAGGGPGGRGRPSAWAASRRLLATYGLFERGVLEAAVVDNGGNLPQAEAEARRRRLVGWIDEEDLASSIGSIGLEFLRTRVGGAAEADYRDSLVALETAAALAWALGRRRSLGAVDAFTDPLALATALPMPFGPAPPFAGARLVPDDALRGRYAYLRRWHWRAEIALSKAFATDGSAAVRVGIVRVAAHRAFEDGIIDEIEEGDFPVRGAPFRSLSDEEADRVATVTGARASALAWLLGED